MSNLINLVRVRTQPGAAEKLLPAMLENAAQSVKEKTCYQFDVIRSQTDDNEFIFYEVYEDEAALAAHRQTPHFLAYWKLLEELGDQVEREATLYTQIG